MAHNTQSTNLVQLAERQESTRITPVIGVSDTYLRIEWDDGDLCIPYAQCSTAVQGIRPGDNVMVSLVGGIHIVTARLLREGEEPFQVSYTDDGVLTLTARQGLRIRTPKAEITIDKDGNLQLAATNIDSEAEQENRLSGQAIKLN